MNERDSVFELVRSANLDLLREALAHEPKLATQRDASGVSALLHARYRGNEEILAALLATDPPLDFFEAAALGRTERVAALLQDDADAVRQWSADGFSPLQLASYFGHAAAVDLLLARGADVAAVSRNPMHLTALHSAVAGRHATISERLLEHGADANAVQAGGFTPLHAAALLGDVGLIDLLLAHGADPSLQADDGRDAAAMAAERHHQQTATRLRD